VSLAGLSASALIGAASTTFPQPTASGTTTSFAASSAGALESMYCTKDFSVDGVPGDVSVPLVEILRAIAQVALRPTDVGPAR
jgi:hypothetical protein